MDFTIKMRNTLCHNSGFRLDLLVVKEKKGVIETALTL